MAKVLNPNETYTFSKYFDLPYNPEDILADLGCTLERTDRDDLPYSTLDLPWLPELAEAMRCRPMRVNTVTDRARREALIFPLIDQICDRFDYGINIDYFISVSHGLSGFLDYYVPSPHNLLIIEAKQSDLTKGFTQLAVGMIALDRWIESDCSVFYGAVSTGEVWRFGAYDRVRGHIVEYLPLHAVPRSLEFVTRTIIGILKGKEMKEN